MFVMHTPATAIGAVASISIAGERRVGLCDRDKADDPDLVMGA
jgi:hypothetical protein